MNPAPPSSTAAPIPLTELAIGRKARIAGYDAAAAPQKGRLFEMGLTLGAEIELVRFAPLGDPVDLKVRGYHLSLRKRDAAGIRVTPL